jgi:hypothetical protein
MIEPIEFTQEFERHADCMLDRSPDWEVREKGFASNGMGDLIDRTANFAIALQDWELLLNCIGLCNARKRWPDWLEPGRAERRALRKAGYKRTRSQHSMTADPYIMTLAAISQMKDISEKQRHGWYKFLKIPLRLQRPVLWWYKRALMAPHLTPKFERVLLRNMRWREKQQPRRLVWSEKKVLHREAGHRWRAYIYGRLANNFGFPAYVKYLWAWMAYTTGATLAQVELQRQVPHWNYAVLLLCEKPTIYLAESYITNYSAKNGFQWSGESWVSDKSRLLPLQDKYKMDKDILDYLWDEYKKKSKP